MQRLVPEFLQRPLPGFPRNWVGGAFAWLREGLAAIAPARLRRVGFRPVAILKKLGEAEGADQTIVESFLGVSELRPADTLKSAAARIVLPQSVYFTTTIELPAAARSKVGDAAVNRLDSLSPLPPHEVAVAVGPTRNGAPGRIETDIAFARKIDIDTLIASGPPAAISAIGAEPDDAGRLRFEFYSAPQSAKVLSGVVRDGAFALFAAACALAATDAHLEKRLLAAADHERRLLAALKEEKELSRFLFDVPPDVGRGLNGAELNALIADIESHIPKKSVLSGITIAFAGADLTGYVAVSETDGEKAVRSPSDRPGFDSFSLRVGTPKSP